MWFVLLPWMAALAIWESSWGILVKLTVIAGIAWANLYMFIPRSSSGSRRGWCGLALEGNRFSL